MRNRFLLYVLLLGFAMANVACKREDRIAELISQMTLDEKCGQLSCPIGFNFYGKTADSLWLDTSFLQAMDTMPLGSCWAVLRADPWSRKTAETGLHPVESARLLNMMQRHAVEHTRLGIPLLFCEETPHGHMAVGTTVFPTGLSQASTWDPALLEQMGEAMGEELRLQGAQVGYGPVLDIAREPRWSRVEETFGEDPYLTGVLGSAVVSGMERNVCATLKHLAAYGIPEGGHNAAQANVGPNKLLSDYLPAFKMAVDSGARALMTAYNAIDGVPCTANRWLLTDIIRDTWRFGGVVFSDLNAVNALYATHHVAADPAEAAAMALKAGVDIDLGGFNYGGFLKEALHRGLVTEAEIDRAVRHVLQLKFDLGLFDNPYVDEAKVGAEVGSDEHRALARQVALEGTVLLKNDGILPLGKAIRTVAIIGPNADNMYNQLGDYTAPQDPDRIVTPMEGIQRLGFERCLSSQSDAGCFYATYARGCSIRDEADADLDEAVRVAQAADVVVLVVGGSSARDFKTSYEDTGAAIVDAHVSDMECGEGYDRCTLDLLGKQNELMERIFATSKPTIVVYIEGRPLDMSLAAERANALLTMWYPGMEGGTALADILFGRYNPSGRLPLSIPRCVGQLPVYYSQPNVSDYVEGNREPLFPFGYGLSYTEFAYGEPQVVDGEVTCEVSNVGDIEGDVVVQLYGRQCRATLVPDARRLIGFRRVHLKVGETRRVMMPLPEGEWEVWIDKKFS